MNFPVIFRGNQVVQHELLFLDSDESERSDICIGFHTIY